MGERLRSQRLDLDRLPFLLMELWMELESVPPGSIIASFAGLQASHERAYS